MDSSGGDVYANRDEAIPVLRIPLVGNTFTEDDEVHHSKREAIKNAADKLKTDFNKTKDEARTGMQERLLNSLFAQIIPLPDNLIPDDHPIDRRSSTYVERPNFSLNGMSTNFRRFNARIGIVFVFQNQLIRLFTWRIPTHTLSFLSIYTLVCLQPALLPALPLGLIFFFVMIPSFLARHPAPPHPAEATLTDPAGAAEAEKAWESYAYTATPTAPPRRVKPAPELSKDFFRNMRDLQNSMEDFSRLHDSAIATVAPYTDFSDEKLSSTVFLGTFALLSTATVAAHLVPWRVLAVLVGWGMTGAGHPKAQEVLLDASQHRTIKEFQAKTTKRMQEWVETDIVLDAPPEVREVEVFELQRRRGKGTFFTDVSPTNVVEGGAAGIVDDEEWEPWLFTPSPHDPLSPRRLSGAWPVGTQFFEDVQAPTGWSWRDKKWTLDLLGEAWVEEKCITGVEVEREGSRWVYDIDYEGLKGAKMGKTWEEGQGSGRRGEWRRRRWVRLVERKGRTIEAK